MAPFNQRFAIAGWKLLFLRHGTYQPDPKQSAEWNRGAYLVEGLAHCGACHTLSAAGTNGTRGVNLEQSPTVVVADRDLRAETLVGYVDRTTIDQAVEAAASKRRTHQLALFVEPLRCVIDHTRVAQIVRNLVENAYKYTPDDTSVAVTAKGVSGGVAIEVTDDGDGIPEDRRDLLFEAFHRIHDTTAGQDGVGLGLYVVSQLVSAMGGHIDLSSSSNGTSFHIHVPCRTMGLEHGVPTLTVPGAEDAAG